MLVIFDKSEPLPWLKARWVYAFISILTIFAYHLDSNRLVSSPSISANRPIIYLTDLRLKEFTEKFLSASSEKKFRNLRDRHGELSDLNSILNTSEITLLFLFTPFDCAACFSSVSQLAKNLTNKSKKRIQVIGIALEGRPDDVYRFKQLAAPHFSVFTIVNEKLKNRLKTPALIVLTDRGMMQYGCELTPDVATKRRIFAEIESKLNPEYPNTKEN